ncbi:MAG: glycosyltransferase [Micrococcus sp.]|nr:glycosyltransferase [Micrococcus sp.]
MTPSRTPDVVIAHDYLTQRGGAERVVLALHRMFPDAPIYTTLYDPEGTFEEFRSARVITSPMNRVGVFRRDHRAALPLLPLASSAVHARGTIALISSSGWAHGFRFDGPSLVYCHTPARWVYLTDEYLGGPWYRSPKGIVVQALKPLLRRWDRAAARRRTRYVANSTVVRRRIEEVYGREDVGLVFPPHSVDTAGALEPIVAAQQLGEGYLLVVSRLMPYKNVDRVIAAVQATGDRLLVIGRGPERDRLADQAGPETVFAQDLSDAQLRWAYARAAALVAVSHEDFGITPLEASAWGIPTVALRAGGYLDTIDEAVNGVYVDSPEVEDVAAGLLRVRQRTWDSAAIRAHAERFSEERFAAQIRAELDGVRAQGR